MFSLFKMKAFFFLIYLPQTYRQQIPPGLHFTWLKTSQFHLNSPPLIAGSLLRAYQYLFFTSVLYLISLYLNMCCAICILKLASHDIHIGLIQLETAWLKHLLILFVAPSLCLLMTLLWLAKVPEFLSFFLADAKNFCYLFNSGSCILFYHYISVSLSFKDTGSS